MSLLGRLRLNGQRPLWHRGVRQTDRLHSASCGRVEPANAEGLLAFTGQACLLGSARDRV